MDYENIDVTAEMAAAAGGGYEMEEKAGPGDVPGGNKGHWGYGDGAMAEEDVFRVDDDDDDSAVEHDHALPDFANAANRELNAEVIAKEKALLAQKEAARDSKERLTIMKEHLKNVVSEIGHTQKMLESKSAEVKSEDHLKQLAERECGRIRQELRGVDARADDIRDALNAVQNNIFKGSEKLEQFKVAMNFNQEELEQWALAAKQKEEDNTALEAYARADEGKIKDQTLALERLTLALAERKRDLERETTETQAKQIELDKTAEEFRQLHKERQELVKQWKDALDTIQARDQEIADTATKYADQQEKFRSKKEALAEQAKLLQQMKDENAEFEGKITAKTRALGRQREDFIAAQAKLAEFQDEVEVMRNTLSKAAGDVVVSKTSSAGLAAAKDDKSLALEAARAKYAAAEKKLEAAASQSDKVEAIAARREEELKEEEGRHDDAAKDVIALKEALFKQNSALFALRKAETTLISEIAGSQSAAKSMQSKIHKLDADSVRQQELIYTAEFQIQQLERKVSRASGERSDEEKQQMNARIAELTAELDAAVVQEKMLAGQSKVLREDLRRVQRQEAELEEQLSVMKAKTTEAQLQSKATEDALKAATKDKEEVLVTHDLLKLEVRKLRSVLSGRANEVFGLENHKAQLEMSVQERRKEVSVHLEVQRAQSKLCEDERHKVTLELKERIAKVSVLKAKYEMLAARMRSDDGDGEERSQAYYVIKAAQKREELQREGDELDAKIRRLEREVKALTATLYSLTDMNTAFRQSTGKADLDSADGEKLRKLQAQSKAAADILFRKKRDLQHAAGDVEEESTRLEGLRTQVVSTQSHIEHLRASKAKAEDDVAGVMTDVKRATDTLNAASASHRRTYGGGASLSEPTPEEVSFASQAVTDTNNNVLFTLAQLAKEFPEMQPTLYAALQSHGLRVPQRPPSRTTG